MSQMPQDAYPRTSRRKLLKTAAAMASAAAFASAPELAKAQRDAPAAYALRALRRRTRVVPAPPKPLLAVLALNRLTFGVRPGDVEAFDALGATGDARLQAWVDQQLNPTAIEDAACDARLAALGLSTLDKSLEQLWLDHHLNHGGDYNVRSQPARETRTMVWTRAVYSERQLWEMVVAFWRNHFSIYAWDTPIVSVFPHFEREVLRAHALGNFRAMLEAVAASTAMLYYLDNYINQVAGPNENWARELFELHTLGAENYLGVRDPNSVPKDSKGRPVGYVDNDVYEATRCFTGWRVSNSSSDASIGNTGAFLYYRSWHDRFNKIVLGKYLPADQADLKDGRDVLDLVAYHPGTSQFIARKLCRRFIADNPSDDVVSDAARVFRQNKSAPDQITQVLRAILLHPDFKKTWGEKLKRPFEVTTAMLRALGSDWTYSDSFGSAFDWMGMPLLGRRSPDGYPDVREGWNGSTSFLYRWRLCNALVEKSVPTISHDLVAQMPSDKRTANTIADFWIQRLLGRPMHPVENRNEIVTFMAQGANPDAPLTSAQIADRLPRMVSLLMMAPDFQIC